MDISGSQSAAATSSKTSSPPVVVDKTSTTEASEKKRQRVERACDACRHKKIKCDGKRPCTHCVGYTDVDCTYIRPSNRHRNAAAKRVKELESYVNALEAFIRKMFPGFSVENHFHKKGSKFIHHEPKPTETPITIENAIPVSKESEFSGVITPVTIDNALPVSTEPEFSGVVITPATVENAIPVSTESEFSGVVITPATVENAIPVLPELNLSEMMLPLNNPWLIPGAPNANIYNDNDMTKINQMACVLPQQPQQQYEQNLGAVTCENQGTDYYPMPNESLNGNHYPTTYQKGNTGYYPTNCGNQDPGYCYRTYGQ